MSSNFITHSEKNRNGFSTLTSGKGRSLYSTRNQLNVSSWLTLPEPHSVIIFLVGNTDRTKNYKGDLRVRQFLEYYINQIRESMYRGESSMGLFIIFYTESYLIILLFQLFSFPFSFPPSRERAGRTDR